MQNVEVKLNQGQQAAADGFFEFLLSDETEMGISGPGGVGKTFLMGQLIDKIMPMYFRTCQMMDIKAEFNEVAMTATTNKAADVLSLSIGRPVSTVHSFFNLKVQDDFTSGVSKVTKTKQWMVHQFKIIFIDECSMIDKALYNFIQEGTFKCKIVYVGDQYQMAPVREKLSKVYQQGMRFYELTEPMRNANQPALQEICSIVRESVKTGEFYDLKLVPGVIDYLTDNEMPASLLADFQCPDHNNKIVAYTNSRVVEFNDYVRDIRGLPAAWQVGEFVVNNSPIRVKTGILSVETIVKIVDMAPESEVEMIEPGVDLEICYMDLENQHGEVYAAMPVPMNSEHFTKLVKYYANRKNWERYYYLKNTFPDLRARDASTVYKAQGSDCETIYIDLGNLSTCKDPEQAARQMYVAVSRARQRIIFYGELAEKFGRIIS